MIINKETLIKNIQRDIPDNTIGAISPRDVRQNLIDIVDSIHLLTFQHPLLSKNLYTIPERTTAVGVENFIHLNVEDAITADNTAVGFQSLNANYRGIENTAIGSFSVSCNINGQANIGVGFHSLAGNINGAGNLGVGNYTLNGNREGDFNIAIGHGAGYYANRDSSYQFFLGIHPVDRDYICDNPSGEGLVPLMLGNLKQSELSLGVGVRNLNPGSTLQVEGNINPHSNLIHNLGSTNYHWNNLYLNRGIEFNGGANIIFSNGSFYVNRSIFSTGQINSASLNIAGNGYLGNNLTINNDLIVNNETRLNKNVYLGRNFSILGNNLYTFCSPSNRFINSFFNNIYSKYVQSDVFEAQRQVHFSNKTLHLGSDSDVYSLDGGGPDGLFDFFDPSETIATTAYLNDDDLEDAGLIAHSTTNNQQYEFVFKPLGSLPSAKASSDSLASRNWYSNISLSIRPDSFLNTSNIYGKENLKIGTFSNISNKDPRLHFTNNDTINIGFSDTSSHLTSGNVNFTTLTQEFDTFNVNFMSQQNGVNIFHRYRTNTSSSPNHGFDVGYISDSSLPLPAFFNEQLGQDPKRFVIRSFINEDYSSNCFTLMQGNTDGVVGISNFSHSDNMLPDTIFNVRSTGNAVARFTAETNGSVKSSLELLSRKNCLDYGTTLSYYNDTEFFDIQSLSNSNNATLLRLDNSGHVAIQPSGFTHENSYNYMLSIGSEQYPQACIGMFESSDSFVPASGYGVLFIRPKEIEDQVHDLKFMDGSGNIFNISMTASAASENIFDRSVYTSNNGSTYAGLGTPPTINSLDSTDIHNVTAYGYRAFRNLTDSTSSVAIGARVGENFVNGDRNLFIGCPNANITSGSDNFILGANSRTYSGDSSDTFDLDGKIYCLDTSSSSAKYHLDGLLNIGGRIYLDTGSIKYSGTSLSIGKGSSSIPGSSWLENNASVLVINENSSSFTSTLTVPQLIFSDGTSISNASFLTSITNNANDIEANSSRLDDLDQDIFDVNKRIDDNIVEGFVYGGVLTPPSHPSSPTNFQIIQYKTINGQWKEIPATPENATTRFVTITNRDPGLSLNRGEYILAQRVGSEYRVVWVSNYRLPSNEL